MVIFVRLIGLLSVIAGIIFIIDTDRMKKVAAFFLEGNRFYFAGVIRILVGILFLMAASQCKFPWVIIILGAVILIAGISIFSMGIEKVKDIVTWIYTKPNLFLRVLCLLSIILGGIILYCA